MLSPDYLQHVADEAVDLYSELEERIIKDIARRIIGAGTMTESARWQIKIAQESGKLYDEIIDEIAEGQETSKELIQQIFEDACIESLSFDDKIYKAAGLNPIPIKQSKKMLRILTSTLKQTNSELYNLTKTTADSSQDKFIQACDNAYMDVITGAFDYNTAIFNAIEEISKSGVEIIYPSGRRDKVEVAVRRNIMTSISQTTGEMQIARMDEMECDLVEVSAHAGARPSHALWQGQVYSRSGISKKYPDFVSCTGYGTITGLKGINCRHDFYPFFEGLSKRAYTNEEIDKINNETVTYNKEKISKYDATQMQRQMERTIRQNKREIAGYEGIILEGKDEELIEEARSRLNNKEQELKQNQEVLRDFINQTGLSRDRARERINQFDKDIPVINKKSTDKAKDDIITSSYIRKNVAKGYDTKEDEEVISNAINIMPEKIQNELKNTEFEIITKDMTDRNYSRYDRKNNKFYIYENSDIYEVIHEIGHYVETRYNVLEDSNYIDIRNKGLENESIYAVKELTSYPGHKGIKNNKFISEQQGLIYPKDLRGTRYIMSNGKINLNCLGEYFSEGFREYYQNRNNLKLKDSSLFNYIEELLKNDK